MPWPIIENNIGESCLREGSGREAEKASNYNGAMASFAEADSAHAS